MFIYNFLLILILSIVVVYSSNVQVSKDEIIAKKGSEDNLVCSANTKVLGCSFQSPANHNFNMLRGAAYEEGDIQEVHLTENDCAMKIMNIKESQNGQWQCNVTTKDSHGGYSVDVAKIKLVVAIAPVEVYLKVNGGDPIAGPIEMNLEETNQSNIQCIATGARPAPTFKWFIADELLEDITVTESKEDVEDGKANYMSTFDYTGQPKDVAQMLKCEVIHPGYDNADRQDGINLAKAQLKLRFKPADFSHEKPEVQKNLQYGTNQVQSDDKQTPADAPYQTKVQVKFRSNPKPTDCLWSNIETRIEETKENDVSKNKESCKSKISDGGMDGEYFVNLETRETTHLEITNSLGTSTYEFIIDNKAENIEIVVANSEKEKAKIEIETTTMPSTNSTIVIKKTKTNLSRVSEAEKPKIKTAKISPVLWGFVISVLVIFFVASTFLYFKKNKAKYHCLSTNGVTDSKDSLESQTVSKKISTASNQTNDSGIGNGDTSVEFAMDSNRFQSEDSLVV